MYWTEGKADREKKALLLYIVSALVLILDFTPEAPDLC